MTAWFALLPVLTLVFGSVAAYPAGASTAALRLALMRGALAVGAFGVLATEALSALHALTPAAVRAAWTLAVVVAGSLALRRLRPAPPARLGWPARSGWPARLGWPAWLLVGGLAALVLAELVVALVAAPNNADSLSYHLPRIENWAQNRSVELYPTSIHRQAGISPGAEYLLLHLRLLAGFEEFTNVLQWAAALGCAVVVSRIAARLGAGRSGQLIAAATVLTAPMVALEATSTQTDLVVAFWVACGASLALDGGRVWWLALATGLTAVTKINGLAVLAPFLAIWLAGQVRMAGQVRRWPLLLGRCAALAVTAALLAGPFVVRADREWGGLTGDPGVTAIALPRHDPAAVAVNGARIAATVLATTSATVNSGMVRAVDGFGDLLGVRADDQTLVFGAARFDSVALPYPDEDHAAYPIQALAVLLAIGYGLVSRGSGPARAYAGAAGVSLVLTAALIAWQPWVNRLILPTFVAAVPLVGWAAGRVVSRRAGAVLVAAVLVLAGTRAAYTVWAGQPRPLGTANSVLVVSREHDRYVRARDDEVPYQLAAQRIAASGARRVGLLQSSVGLEYAWWVELRRAGLAPTIVSLDSALPKHPAPGIGTVDAAVCTLDAADCARHAPARWTVVEYPGVSVLLSPGAARRG